MLKKHPVFTAHYCGLLENLRIAIEILSGKRTFIFHLDPNTGWAEASIDHEPRQIPFVKDLDGPVIFRLDDTWYIAGAADNYVTVIIPLTKSVLRQTMRGLAPILWVGTSMTDRREKMLCAEDIERFAHVGTSAIMELVNRS